MPIWNTDIDSAPHGRPILLRMTEAPLGWNTGDGATVTLGQRGDRKDGFWLAEGFFASDDIKPKPGAWIFMAWAEVPAFDGVG